MCELKSHDRRVIEYVPGEQPVKLRFWQMDQVFRCPVVGVCLSDAEQKLLLKSGSRRPRRETPFDRHEALVAASHEHSDLSERADRLLNEKYRDELAALDGATETELVDQWCHALSRGTHAPVLWAAATRPDLSPIARREIFGSIHMTMHANAQELARLRAKLAAARTDAKGLRKTLHELSAAKKRLESENMRLRPLAEAAPASEPATSPMPILQAVGTEGGERSHTQEAAEWPDKHGRLRSRIRELERRLAAAESDAAGARRENDDLCRRLDAVTSRSAAIVRETSRALEDALEARHCSTDCPAHDLCGKRVLIVGGITRMESLYRSLIEEHGGICELHDGHVRGGRKKLEGDVKRADVVICLSEVNSHAACSVVKGLGKKHGKPVHLIGSSSLHAVSQAIGVRAAS